MAGFGDLPIGDGSLFAQPTTSKSTPVAPSKPGGLAGLLGGAYDSIVKPFVHQVAGVPADLIHSVGAVGDVAQGLATAPHSAQANAFGNKAYQQLRQIPLLEGGLAENVQQAKTQSLGNVAERTGGAITNNAMTLASPVLGGESFAGKTGLRLVGNAIGTGAKIGGVSGVANAAAQGGGGKQLFVGGGEGAVGGAAAGGLGGTLGATLGSAAGKAVAKGAGKLGGGILEGITGRGGAAADVAGAGADAASGNVQGGLFNNAATNAGTKAAQNIKADQAKLDFSGTTNTERAALNSRDKQGDVVGLQQVSNYLRGLDMPGDAQHMAATHDFMTGVIGGSLKDATDGTQVKVGSPADVGRTFVTANQGTLGGLSKSGAGAAGSTLKQIRSITDNLGDRPTVSDTLQAISGLEGAKSQLAEAVGAGNPVAKAQAEAYQAVADHLHNALDSAGVNQAVRNFKVDPTLEQTIRSNAVDSGVSPKAAQHAIDSLNNASSYSSLRSEMQPAVVGGQLADLAQRKFAASVPEAAGSKNGVGIPSWELAMSLHNPAYLAAGAARLAQNSGITDRIAARVNPGAFNAARDAALAPDAATARKLALPGGGPASGAPSETANPNAPAVTPASTAPAPTPAASVQEPTGIPAAPEPTTTPTRPPASALDQAILKVAGGAHQVAGVVSPAISATDTAVRNAVSSAPGAIQAGIRAGASVPGQAIQAAKSPGSLNGLIGAVTGEAASQAGQNPGDAAAMPGATGGVDLSSIDQITSQAGDASNPQPTLDASSIPGGTIQDLEAEIQADPKNATIYNEIYAAAQKQVADSAPQSLNATQAKNLTNIQNATAALHNYVQGLNSLSDSTRGAGVGQLSALLGKIGLGGANATTAAQLDSNKEELAIQLAQAMNNGNKPQGAQIEQIKAMLPSVNDPKTLAARKIDQLSTNLSDYLNIATTASVSNRNSGNTSSLLAGLTGGN